MAVKLPGKSTCGVNRWKTLKTLMLDHSTARYARSKLTIRWYAGIARRSFAADAERRLKRLMSWESAEASRRQRLSSRFFGA
jgi:hypothetical protein